MSRMDIGSSLVRLDFRGDMRRIPNAKAFDRQMYDDAVCRSSNEAHKIAYSLYDG